VAYPSARCASRRTGHQKRLLAEPHTVRTRLHLGSYLR
jgi:hypothetical protein